MGLALPETFDTRPISLPEAAAFENAEARAWSDMYAAAPTAWAAAAGLGFRWIGESLALYWAASGRRYFSRAIGLGLSEPVSEEQLDRILALWRELGIDMFLLQSLPHCRPDSYEQWLHERGFAPFDAQDRVIRGGQPLSAQLERARERRFRVEPVTADTAAGWSRFIQDVYRLDTGPWISRLIGRRGWHQYVAWEAGRIVAARGMFIGDDGIAWLGMDGPVPGITSSDYEPDAAICARIVSDGLARGARAFIADIEAPSPHMNTPAYEYFSALGFRRPYARVHYTRNP